MSRVGAADAVVIGAGLFGCAVAERLASLGRSVLVLDRGDLGGEASGANSGNLHLQLSPATHADDTAGWMERFARQLPLFVAAIEEWEQLAKRLPAPIALRRTGGIMVAETAAEVEALETKIRLERAHGLAVDLLGVGELRSLAPYLGDGIVGASYCAGEGMADPLAAVASLADLARKAGAMFRLHTVVTGLQEGVRGWEVATSAGHITCRQVVIAAGLWSAQLAAMVGVHLPITHRPIHVSVTEVAEPLVGHLCYHTSLRLTLKQVPRGNLVIGGGWGAGLDEARDRPIVLRDSLVRSLGVVQRVVPATGPLGLLRCWAGRNVYTPDGWPILGPVPGRPGLHLAVCNTYGFTAWSAVRASGRGRAGRTARGRGMGRGRNRTV